MDKSNDVCVHQDIFPVLLFLLVFVATSLLSEQLFGSITPGDCGRRSRRTVTPLMVVRTLVPWPQEILQDRDERCIESAKARRPRLACRDVLISF